MNVSIVMHTAKAGWTRNTATGVIMFTAAMPAMNVIPVVKVMINQVTYIFTGLFMKIFAEKTINLRILTGILLVLASLSFCEAKTVSQNFKVKYLSVDHVYLDGGSSDGLAVGDTVVIVSNGKTVASLKVDYVSDHSASCIIIDKKQDINVGDTVLARVDQPVATGTEKTERRQRVFDTNKRKSAVKTRTRVSGYLSMQWYQYSDIGNNHQFDFQQPTVRFKLYAKNLWDDEYFFRIKLRSRYNQRARSFSNSVPRNEWRNRLYEISFSYENEASPFNYRAGRIISNKFSGVGYIDGILLQHNPNPDFHWGVFAGTQPEWQYSDFQTSLQKYGAFATYEKGDYGEQRFESTLAAAGEYHGSMVSREFIYLQNIYSQGHKWNIYQSMELDVNRDWRKQKTGKSLSLSGLYINGRYYFTSDVSAGLSYDNRRNYYTYELRSLADSLFDDAFRQGIRASLSARLTKNVRVFANSGLRDQGKGGNLSYSYMGGINLGDLFNQGISLSGRGAGFSNIYTEGFNPSISLSKYFNGGHSVGLNYGSYLYTLKANKDKRKNQWGRIDFQIELPLYLYFSGNFEYDWGDDNEGTRIFAELGYRF